MKSIKRKNELGEVYTPEFLINEILDKLTEMYPGFWDDPSKIFTDNSAGNGNLLIAVLKYKLANGHDPLQAISTIYGVELMRDNVEEMKQRLLDALPDLDDTQKQQAIEIINYNIVCHDALTWDYENWKAPANPKAKSLF